MHFFRTTHANNDVLRASYQSIIKLESSNPHTHSRGTFSIKVFFLFNSKLADPKTLNQFFEHPVVALSVCPELSSRNIHTEFTHFLLFELSLQKKVLFFLLNCFQFCTLKFFSTRVISTTVFFKTQIPSSIILCSSPLCTYSGIVIQ